MKTIEQQITDLEKKREQLIQEAIKFYDSLSFSEMGRTERRLRHIKSEINSLKSRL